MGLSRIEMERLNAKRFAKEVLALRQQVRGLQHELARFQPVAVRHSPQDGGFLFTDSGSGSDWKTRYPDGELLYVREGD